MLGGKEFGPCRRNWGRGGGGGSGKCIGKAEGGKNLPVAVPVAPPATPFAVLDTGADLPPVALSRPPKKAQGEKENARDQQMTLFTLEV